MLASPLTHMTQRMTLSCELFSSNDMLRSLITVKYVTSVNTSLPSLPLRYVTSVSRPIASYIYDRMLLTGLGRIQEFFQSMERRQLDIQLTASHLTDVNRSYIVLRKLDSQMPPDERNIIIDATSNSSLHSILQQVRAAVIN